MKKTIVLAFTLLFSLLAGCIEMSEEKEIEHYDIHASIDFDNHSLQCVTEITLNKVDKEFYFELGRDFTINSISDERGKELGFESLAPSTDCREYKTKGAKKLIVNYSGVLAPDENSRKIGYGNYIGEVVYIHNSWYPVCSGHTWATVDLEVEVPEGYSVITVGELKEKVQQESRVTYCWSTDFKTREIPLTAGKYRTKTIYYNGIPLSAYLLDVHKDKIDPYLRAAHDIFDFYTEKFGPYPFEKWAMVEIPKEAPLPPPELIEEIGGSGVTAGHAEVSYNIIFSPTFDNREVKDVFIAHEIAHQWFSCCIYSKSHFLQGIEINYPQLLYEKEVYGKETFDRSMEMLAEEYFRETEDEDIPIADFDKEEVGRRVLSENYWLYQAIVYDKTALVLHTLRYVVGDNTFYEIMKEYRARYLFREPTIEDFIAICEDVYGEDLGWFFDEWLYNPGVPDYSLSIGRESIAL